MHLFVVLGKGTMLKTLVRFGFVVACSVCLCALECVATPAACIKATRVCVYLYVCMCCVVCRGKEVNPSGGLLLRDTSGSKRSVEGEGRWEASPPHEPLASESPARETKGSET